MSSRFQPATTPLRPSRPTLAVTAILVAVAVNLTLLGVLRLLQRNEPVASSETVYELTVLDLVEPPQRAEPPSLVREPAPSADASAAADAAAAAAAPALPALPGPQVPAAPSPAPPPMPLDLPTATLTTDLQALAPLPPREPPPAEATPVVAVAEPEPRPADAVDAVPAAAVQSPAPTAPPIAQANAPAQTQALAGLRLGGGGLGSVGDSGAAAAGAGAATSSGEDIVYPSVLHRVEPRYPESARRQGAEGKVTVRFLVTTSGEVRHATVVSATSQRFEAAALEAVARWRFTPALHNGVAEPSQCEITFRFRLDR